MPTLSYSVAFTAWVKITDIPSTTATIFSMYAADVHFNTFPLILNSHRELKLDIN